MKRDLGKLKDLSSLDLEKIAADIGHSGIRQAAAAAAAQRERPIDKTCVQRFNDRSFARHFLSDSARSLGGLRYPRVRQLVLPDFRAESFPYRCSELPAV